MLGLDAVAVIRSRDGQRRVPLEGPQPMMLVLAWLSEDGPQSWRF